jgi:DNA-binding MarR family transcriptional regulator
MLFPPNTLHAVTWRVAVESGPVYELGHLMVAAIRVISHRESRPPTLKELGDLLGFSPEFTGQMIRSLEEKNIVKTVKSAYDDRFEIDDHIGLEELPKEIKGPGIDAEIEDFEKRFQEKQEKLESLFESDELEEQKQEKIKSMEDELKGFKEKKKDFGSELFKEEDESSP